MFKFFIIDGFSLFPLLKQGQWVLCMKPFFLNKIKINDLVLFRHSYEGMMIKRVDKIESNSYFVKGENAFSIDSRNFGSLKKEEVLYKVIYKFKINCFH